MSKIACNIRTGRPIEIGERVMRVKRSKYGRYTTAIVREFSDPEQGLVLLEFQVNNLKLTCGKNYGIIFKEVENDPERSIQPD